jgi:acyl-CoA synthetase (AMP-forming)/AMP-acid ligase II
VPLSLCRGAICFFAVLMAGGRVVNFSPLAAPRELKY